MTLDACPHDLKVPSIKINSDGRGNNRVNYICLARGNKCRESIFVLKNVLTSMSTLSRSGIFWISSSSKLVMLKRQRSRGGMLPVRYLMHWHCSADNCEIRWPCRINHSSVSSYRAWALCGIWRYQHTLLIPPNIQKTKIILCFLSASRLENSLAEALNI